MLEVDETTVERYIVLVDAPACSKTSDSPMEIPPVVRMISHVSMAVRNVCVNASKSSCRQQCQQNRSIGVWNFASSCSCLRSYYNANKSAGIYGFLFINQYMQPLGWHLAHGLHLEGCRSQSLRQSHNGITGHRCISSTRGFSVKSFDASSSAAMIVSRYA